MSKHLLGCERLDKSHSAVGAETPSLSSLKSEGCPSASREPQEGTQGDGSSSKPGTGVGKKQNVVDEGSAGRVHPPHPAVLQCGLSASTPAQAPRAAPVQL